MAFMITYDSFLSDILEKEGNYRSFMNIIFNFLLRRSNFFKISHSGIEKNGLPTGEAFSIVCDAFECYKQLAEQETAGHSDSVPDGGDVLDARDSKPVSVLDTEINHDFMNIKQEPPLPFTEEVNVEGIIPKVIKNSHGYLDDIADTDEDENEANETAHIEDDDSSSDYGDTAGPKKGAKQKTPMINSVDYEKMLDLRARSSCIPVKDRTRPMKTLYHKLGKYKLIRKQVFDPYLNKRIYRLMIQNRILLPKEEMEPCVVKFCQSAVKNREKVSIGSMVKRIRQHYFGVGSKTVVSRVMRNITKTGLTLDDPEIDNDRHEDEPSEENPRQRAPIIHSHHYEQMLQFLAAEKPKPVKERTTSERSMYKKIYSYGLKRKLVHDPCLGQTLYRLTKNNLIVLPVEEIKQCVWKMCEVSKGSNMRKIASDMKKCYFGIGRKVVKAAIQQKMANSEGSLIGSSCHGEGSLIGSSYPCVVCQTSYPKPCVKHPKTELSASLEIDSSRQRQFFKKLPKRKHLMNLPYACKHKQCGLRFSNRSSLYRHMFTTTHPRGPTKASKVLLASRYQNVGANSQRTNRKVPVSVSWVNVLGDDGVAVKNDKEKLWKHKCTYCEKKFLSVYSLFRHQFIHTDGYPYSCSVCNKGFVKKYMLEKHAQVHAGGKNHSCHLCGKFFAEQSHCDNHVRRFCKKRETAWPYQCQTCLHGFKNQESCYVHSRHCSPEWRKSSKVYTCEFCQQTFKKLYKATRHYTTHLGQMKYCCEFCGRQFDYKHSLKLHIFSQHEALKKVCTECNITFTTKSDYVQHVLTHKGGFSCSHCGRMCQSKYYLKLHEMTHSDSYPFSCQVCQKSFKKQQYLREHERRHCEMKPHQCQYCEQRFSKSSQKMEHEKSHCSDMDYHRCVYCLNDFQSRLALNIHENQCIYKPGVVDNAWPSSYM